jgi:hypothetical protein
MSQAFAPGALAVYHGLVGGAGKVRKALRRRSVWVACAVVCQFSTWWTFCCAQPPGEAKRAEPKPPASQEADDATGGIDESLLQIIYLIDNDGKRQPVLNFKYEDFERLQVLAAGPLRPTFTIDRMTVTGEAMTVTGEMAPRYARLSVEFTISASDKHWVRVPLRLGGAVLAEPVTFHDEGECAIDFDTVAHEYVAWFRGESETPHRVTMQVLVPLENQGGRSRLRLAAPRATYRELLFNVPLARAAAEVTQGGVLESTQSLDGTTKIKAIGLESDFELAWHDASEPIVELQTVLAVKGEIVTKIEGSSVQSTALLTVNSFGGEFQSFRVRLPFGATLVPEAHEGYSVTLANRAGEAADDSEPRLIEVLLKNKSVGPVKVQLTTQQAHDVVHPNEPLELGGFEVLGAARQSGYISVAVDDAWQVSFGKLQRVRQVEDLPDEMRRGDLAAGFSYYGQPYSLPGRIMPRATVLFVEPSFLAQVYADRIELASTIKYRIDGAKAFALEVDFSGWNVDLTSIDSVEPAGLIDAANVVAGEGVPLSVPLKQAMKGELTLAIRARRPVPAGAEAVEFTLPRPKADNLGQAGLIVLSADNIALTPFETDIFGLVRRQVPPATALPAHQHEPLGYRSESAGARFAAAFHVDTRRVTSQVRSVVSLSRSGGGVSQTITYDIAHEAVDSFLLDVPPALAEPGLIEASVDGHTLPIEEVGPITQGDAEGAAGDQPVQMRVTLLEKRIGKCELALKYQLADWRQAGQSQVPTRIPLAMPGGGECLGNEVSVLSRPGIDVRPLDSAWTTAADNENATSADGVLRLTAAAPRSELLLGLRLDEPRAAEPTVVERCWIQTRFGPNGRRDRAVFVFSSRQNRLTVQLPQGILSPQFRLDGQAVSDAGPRLDERVISLPKPGRHVLEVGYTYHVTTVGPRRGRWAIEVPRLEAEAEVRETYWQLVLPRDEYLLAWPAQLSPEASWAFNGIYWGRRAALEQSDLETWCGLSEHATALPAMTNRYLFSVARLGDALEVRTVGRSLLVLGASGLVLGCGLALIYLPILRHPAVGLAASVGVLAAAVMAPEFAVLGLQAAALGLALTVLAGLLKRGAPPSRSRWASRGASSSIARGSTRSHPRIVAPVAPVSTETAAVAVEMPVPEANA